MLYKCECGKTFENKQSFLGHKSNCDIHLKSVGKNFWTKDNKDAHRKKKIIEKYGSLEECGCYGKSSSNDTIMLAHGFLPVIDSGQETFIWKLTGK